MHCNDGIGEKVLTLKHGLSQVYSIIVNTLYKSVIIIIIIIIITVETSQGGKGNHIVESTSTN